MCDTLDHFPDPLFHFAALPDSPPTTPLPPSRPEPAADGSDLVGRWFHEPDLGVCQVTALGEPFRLPPGAGNRASGPRLAPGFHHTLHYLLPSGSVERSSVAEVADWVSRFPADAPPPPPVAEPLPLVRRSPRGHSGHVVGSSSTAPPAPPCSTSTTIRPSTPTSSTSPISDTPTWLPALRHALAAVHATFVTSPAATPQPRLPLQSASVLTATQVLNLDTEGRPLSFPRVLTGPDSAAWHVAAGDDLRMLFVTSKCLVPTHSPSSTPT